MGTAVVERCPGSFGVSPYHQVLSEKLILKNSFARTAFVSRDYRTEEQNTWSRYLYSQYVPHNTVVKGHNTHWHFSGTLLIVDSRRAFSAVVVTRK